MTKKLFKPANPASIDDNEVGYMTYIDILKELQYMDEEKIIYRVQVYDRLDDVFLPVGRIISRFTTCLEV